MGIIIIPPLGFLSPQNDSTLFSVNCGLQMDNLIVLTYFKYKGVKYARFTSHLRWTRFYFDVTNEISVWVSSRSTPRAPIDFGAAG